MMIERWKCSECGHVCTDDEVLREHHPFRDGDTIYGCPFCLSASTLDRACEVAGCDRPSANGWPDEQGEYHYTCYEHSQARMNRGKITMYGAIPKPPPETGLKLENGKIREMTPEQRKSAGLKPKPEQGKKK